MTEVKFERLSQFLHNPDWEATNNGAERAGRAFRHRQAPHFNLRKKEHIENAINVASCLRKNAALQPPPQPFHTCQRGRKRRMKWNVSATADVAAAPTKHVNPPLPRAAYMPITQSLSPWTIIVRKMTLTTGCTQLGYLARFQLLPARSSLLRSEGTHATAAQRVNPTVSG